MFGTHKMTAAVMFVLACGIDPFPVSGQQAIEVVPLVSLIERSQQLETLEGDAWETQWIRSDALLTAASLAWLTDDKQAIEKAELAAEELVQAARDAGEDDMYDQPMLIRAEMLAARGKWEQAAKVAWEIPEQAYRAEARGRIAVMRARAGDHTAYRQEMAKALELIEQLLEIDRHRPADEREWPGYTAAYMLLTTVDDLVLAGVWDKEQAIGELKWLAQSFEGLPLSEGAQAEVYSITAFGYASMGADAAAREWIKRTLPLLQKQRRIVEALDEAVAWMAYGVEGIELQLVLAYAELGDYAAAQGVLEQIKVPHTMRSARAYLTAYLAGAGRHGQAAGNLKQTVDEAIKLCREAKQQAEEEGRGPDEEDWLVDMSSDAFWAVFIAAEAATNLGEAAELKRLRSAMSETLFQYAIDLGIAWATHRPLLRGEK